MTNYSPLLLSILITILVILLLYYLIEKKRYKKKRSNSEQKTSLPAIYEPENSDHNLTRIPSKEELDLQKPAKEEKQIIGVVTPIGFWTKKILEENMPRIMNILQNKDGQKNYWQQFVGRKVSDKDNKRGRG